MNWLARLSVRRPVMASVLILIIVVVGAVGYRSLGVDKFPKIDFPAVTVTTVYPGAAPASVESDVTDPIESAINTISGLETLASTTTEGVSVVVVMFDLTKDVDVAAQEVRDRIELIKTQLPAGIEAPQVQKMDPDAAPVLMLSLKGGLPIEELTRIADDVVRSRLERIDGVGQVQVIGGRERRISIHLDPVRMRGAGVSALEVQRAIRAGNADVPGGQLDQGPVAGTLRVVGRVGSPERLGDLVVRQAGDRPIRVRDVADVEDGIADAESAGFRDGVPSVVLAVRKQSGGNTVEVVDLATAAVADLLPSLPDGVSLEIVRDNSETIRTSIDSVLEHLVLGGLLAALVVLIFLGDLRSTVIAAISIPVSLIGTFALMSWIGFTLNMMTLLALALSVGIVIDDSIVVLENVHRYIHEKGMKPFPAAVHATREIAPAVLATSLSLMAVFLPVAFMGGIVGRFLASFGITMAFAVGVSLVVSFTLVPMLAARMLPPAPAPGTHVRPSWLVRGVDAAYRPFERVYMAMLRFSMRRRWVIVALCVGAMASVGVLAKTAGFGFLPENDDAQFEVYIETPKGTSLDGTAVIAERIARTVRGVDGTAYTLTTIGDGTQRAPNVARVYVRLRDPDQRTASQAQVMAAARGALVGHVPDGTQVAVQLIADFGGGAKNAAIQYVLSGPDLDRLASYGEQAAAALAQVPGAVDVSTNVTEPSAETRLYPDLDRAAALGVDPGELASTLRLLVGGADTSKYEEDGEQYDVFVRAAERFRDDPSALSLLTVPSRTLGQVPLSDVVTLDEGVGPSQINRLSRTRQVTVSANLEPGASQGNVVAALERIIADLDLAPGYHAEPLGQSKEMAKMQQAFLFAFLMAFVFMYLVLAAQFESWLHPFTILLALPLTLPFAFLAVVLFGQQLNLFSILGLLVLFGVVKKNSILQIDQTNQLRATGMPRLEAILEANRQRLRPIMMTTVAFVVGMLPLVFSHGIGAGFSRAMATLVVGGQSLSLLLTLLAIPVIYSLFDDVGLFAGRLRRRLGSAQPVDRGEAELAAEDAASAAWTPPVTARGAARRASQPPRDPAVAVARRPRPASRRSARSSGRRAPTCHRSSRRHRPARARRRTHRRGRRRRHRAGCGSGRPRSCRSRRTRCRRRCRRSRPRARRGSSTTACRGIRTRPRPGRSRRSRRRRRRCRRRTPRRARSRRCRTARCASRSRARPCTASRARADSRHSRRRAHRPRRRSPRRRPPGRRRRSRRSRWARRGRPSRPRRRSCHRSRRPRRCRRRRRPRAAGARCRHTRRSPSRRSPAPCCGPRRR